MEIDERMLRLISLSLEQSGDIRLEKVEELRSAIAAGRYEISPEQIADAMLRDSYS